MLGEVLCEKHPILGCETHVEAHRNRQSDPRMKHFHVFFLIRPHFVAISLSPESLHIPVGSKHLQPEILLRQAGEATECSRNLFQSRTLFEAKRLVNSGD